MATISIITKFNSTDLNIEDTGSGFKIDGKVFSALAERGNDPLTVGDCLCVSLTLDAVLSSPKELLNVKTNNQWLPGVYEFYSTFGTTDIEVVIFLTYRALSALKKYGLNFWMPNYVPNINDIKIGYNPEITNSLKELSEEKLRNLFWIGRTDKGTLKLYNTTFDKTFGEECDKYRYVDVYSLGLTKVNVNVLDFAEKDILSTFEENKTNENTTYSFEVNDNTFALGFRLQEEYKETDGLNFKAQELSKAIIKEEFTAAKERYNKYLITSLNSVEYSYKAYLPVLELLGLVKKWTSGLDISVTSDGLGILNQTIETKDADDSFSYAPQSQIRVVVKDDDNVTDVKMLIVYLDGNAHTIDVTPNNVLGERTWRYGNDIYHTDVNKEEEEVGGKKIKKVGDKSTWLKNSEQAYYSVTLDYIKFDDENETTSSGIDSDGVAVFDNKDIKNVWCNTTSGSFSLAVDENNTPKERSCILQYQIKGDDDVVIEKQRLQLVQKPISSQKLSIRWETTNKDNIDGHVENIFNDSFPYPVTVFCDFIQEDDGLLGEFTNNGQSLPTSGQSNTNNATISLFSSESEKSLGDLNSFIKKANGFLTNFARSGDIKSLRMLPLKDVVIDTTKKDIYIANIETCITEKNINYLIEPYSPEEYKTGDVLSELLNVDAFKVSLDDYKEDGYNQISSDDLIYSDLIDNYEVSIEGEENKYEYKMDDDYIVIQPNGIEENGNGDDKIKDNTYTSFTKVEKVIQNTYFKGVVADKEGITLTYNPLILRTIHNTSLLGTSGEQKISNKVEKILGKDNDNKETPVKKVSIDENEISYYLKKINKISGVDPSELSTIDLKFYNVSQTDFNTKKECFNLKILTK